MLAGSTVNFNVLSPNSIDLCFASRMSTSPADAQTWVWPPAGAAVPPIAATGSFGPVNIGDSMVLEWTPATNPEIDLTCVSESGSKQSFRLVV